MIIREAAKELGSVYLVPRDKIVERQLRGKNANKNINNYSNI